MITDFIVLASAFFTVAFVVAWVVSPELRAWIERPKHRFHDLTQHYDLARQREAAPRQEDPS